MGVGSTPNGSVLEKICSRPPDEGVICLVSENVETFLHLWDEESREVMEEIQMVYTCMPYLHIQQS